MAQSIVIYGWCASWSSRIVQSNAIGTLYSLKYITHAALDDFRYLHKDIANRQTRNKKLCCLTQVWLGIKMVWGLLTAVSSSQITQPFPATKNATPSVGNCPSQNPSKRDSSLSKNPKGDRTNSDLELVSGIVSNDAAAQTFDMQERKVHSNTDNTPTLFWMRKVSIMTSIAPAYPLRSQALHQWFHHYVHHIDFIKGEHNDISNIPSHSSHW